MTSSDTKSVICIFGTRAVSLSSSGSTGAGSSGFFFGRRVFCSGLGRCFFHSFFSRRVFCSALGRCFFYSGFSSFSDVSGSDVSGSGSLLGSSGGFSSLCFAISALFTRC